MKGRTSPLALTALLLAPLPWVYLAAGLLLKPG